MSFWGIFVSIGMITDLFLKKYEVVILDRKARNKGMN